MNLILLFFLFFISTQAVHVSSKTTYIDKDTLVKAMIEYDKMNELMIRCNTKDLDVYIVHHKWSKLTSMTCDEIIKMSDESWKHRIYDNLPGTLFVIVLTSIIIFLIRYFNP